MKREDIALLSDEVLAQKLKTTKAMVGIFIVLILGLLYFEISAYQEGKSVSPMSIITLCAIGGLVSLLPDLKKYQAEISKRI